MPFVSYENEQTSTAMEEGDYECQLIMAEEELANDKHGDRIKLEFVVRSDVEQKYKKKHIWKTFGKKTETGTYDLQKLGQFANALGIPKGQSFELSDLVCLCCSLHIKPYTIPTSGVTIDSVFYAESTKAGQLVQGVTFGGQTGFTEVDVGDDLPF